MNSGKSKPALRKRIADTCQKLKIPAERFDPVSIPKGNLITDTLIDLHCRPKYAGFIWERLADGYEVVIIDSFPLVVTSALIDPAEKVWLILEEEVDGNHKYWVYDGRIKTILRVLRKIKKRSEVYVAPKDCEWLISLNKDQHIILSGKVLYDRLWKLADSEDRGKA
ncbi:DUF6756 family protein [Flavihumibacter solisilvae]|uniref:Uncharacterized protein n=1 Tax=Flavihumibacter solisilvae TaxID=1349421 RepID=A0A0C1IJQ0_9BACT|nr:DUF6756 family protein [Flavihumibacter solisilvae]KIC94405.1 hypothetical protein OI18_12375 [Flavihumibacter solisilvae]